MMNSALMTSSSIVLYLICGGLLAYRLLRADNRLAELLKHWIPAIGVIPVLLHAMVLEQAIFTFGALNLNLYTVFSLITWLMALLFLLTVLRKPILNLGIGIFPLSALAMALEFTRLPPHPTTLTLMVELHILLSIIAFSFFGLATLQAILLAVQERQLRKHHFSGVLRLLPPLETMEQLLFQLITIGFIFLSLSVFNGVLFIENIFAQHLVHKTVLSIISWLVFATLLWGRWRFGWRGRQAIHWTLSGLFILVLGYFGTKLVLDLILQR